MFDNGVAGRLGGGAAETEISVEREPKNRASVAASDRQSKLPWLLIIVGSAIETP